MTWMERIAGLMPAHGVVVRATIAEATGPTPRETGAAMLVTSTTRVGKIGRASVESEAIAAARNLIADVNSPRQPPRWLRKVLVCKSGPVLGESSVGEIRILLELFTAAEVAALSATLGPQSSYSTASGHTHHHDEMFLARPMASGQAPLLIAQVKQSKHDELASTLEILSRDTGRQLLVTRPSDIDGPHWLVERLGSRHRSFYVYGSGLVARALIDVLAGLPFDVVWVEADSSRFPADLPEHVRSVVSSDPLIAARAAKPGGFHAVMSVSHETDHAICRALLEGGDFAYLGVIGSALKRDRLRARLQGEGIAEEALARLVCPIGLSGIRSKSPRIIAVSIAAQALMALEGLRRGDDQSRPRKR